MSKINVLEEQIFNQIAAGEVVERPVNVVKECVENSIDSGATQITVEITNAGINQIKIVDNGCGIETDDFVKAFKPHATSKLKSIDDLEHVATLGFRGEALSSIASVTKVTLISKTKDSDSAYTMYGEAGKFGEITPTGASDGTTIIINDLFFNIPVRRKFLKKSKSEESDITNMMIRLILSHSDIKFKYIVDGRVVYNTMGDGLYNAIYKIYGKKAVENLVKIDYTTNNIKITGYMSKPIYSKPNKSYQTLFINNRYINSTTVSVAIQRAYEYFMMKGTYPMYIVSLEVPQKSIDVNIHPNKLEVKFEDGDKIFNAFYKMTTDMLYKIVEIKDAVEEDKLPQAYKDYNAENKVPIIPHYYTTNDVNEVVIDDTKEIVEEEEEEEEPKPKKLVEVFSDKETMDRLEREMDEMAMRKLAVKEEMDRAYQEIAKKYNLQTYGGFNSDKRVYNDSDKLVGERFTEVIVPKNHDFVLPGSSESLKNQSSTLKQNSTPNSFDSFNSDTQNASLESKFTQPSFMDFAPESTPTATQTKMFETSKCKRIGTLFNTYLLVEQENTMYFIDQHAAHERLLYEKYLKVVNNSEDMKQPLLVPTVVSLNTLEMNFMMQNKALLESLGFEIEDFGDNTIKIDSIPHTFAGLDIEAFINSVLRDIDNELLISKSDLVREYIIKKACKHAVKGNDILSDIEISYLLEHVSSDLDVLLCPHGRPIVVKLSKSDIEKWFKRIV